MPFLGHLHISSDPLLFLLKPLLTWSLAQVLCARVVMEPAAPQQKPIFHCCHLFTCEIFVLNNRHIGVLDLVTLHMLRALLIVGMPGIVHISGTGLCVFPNTV